MYCTCCHRKIAVLHHNLDAVHLQKGLSFGHRGERRVEGKQKRGGYIESTLLLCPSKMETKILFPFYELFNSVFKALNLFLSKYVAEIQLPGNGIRHSAALYTTEFWIGLALVICITSRKIVNAAAIDCSLQPLLSFHHR